MTDKIKSWAEARQGLILAAMILVLTVIYIFIGSEKSYIHMDEAYSLGLSNYDGLEIVDKEGFYDTWHDGEYYKDYLVVNEDERGDFAPVYNNQRNDVHPPLYYFFLRLFMEMNVGKFSMWPGIILNILFQIPAVILLFLISKRLFENIIAAFAATLFSSVSFAALSSVTYIRMYTMAGVFILLMLWLHLLMEEKDKIYRLLPAVGVAALCGSLTHYYTLFFLGTLFLMFSFKLIRQKRWKELAAYVGTLCAAAAASLAIFPYSINHLFFGYRGQGAIENLTKFNDTLKNFGGFIWKAEQNVFNHTLFLILIAFHLCPFLRKSISYERKDSAHIVFIPTAVYFVIVALASPYIELRYIMPVCTLMTLFGVYFFVSILRSASSKRIACALLAVVTAAFFVLPIAIEKEPETIYSRRKPIIEQLSGEFNLPTVYCFNSSCQRFLDDIYLFSILDESYIARNPECSEETFKNIFASKDTSGGIIVFINEGQDNNALLETAKNALGLKESRFMTKLNACYVYYVG